MLDSEPIGFEVNRDSDGEKLRVLYSKTNDKFFQLQESLSECSTFIEDQVMKGKDEKRNIYRYAITQLSFNHYRDPNFHRDGTRPSLYNVPIPAQLVETAKN